MIKIKITLEKVKFHLNKNEIDDLLKLIERAINIESNSRFEVAHIHAAWLHSLKEIAIKLMDKNIEQFDKQVKISLSQAQFMSLLELYAYGFPKDFYDVFVNAAYAKLLKVGEEKKLIVLKGGGHVSPLLQGSYNDQIKRLI